MDQQNKGGRPALPESRVRNDSYRVLLNVDEKRKLREIAEAKGITMGAAIRLMIRTLHPRVTGEAQTRIS